MTLAGWSQAFVTRELGEVFPPCRLVALHVVRDERSLAGVVHQYGKTKRSLEELMDMYAAQLAMGRRVRRRKVGWGCRDRWVSCVGVDPRGSERLAGRPVVMSSRLLVQCEMDVRTGLVGICDRHLVSPPPAALP